MQRRCGLPTYPFAVATWLTAVSPLIAGGAIAQQKLLEPHRPAAVPSVAMSVNAWCADYRRGAVSRAEKANLVRLKAVQLELAPGFNPGKRQGGIDLLAAYQQELERARPDRSSAATYLALVSTVPITFSVVERVNHLLCVSSARTFAQAVADAAESERRQMARQSP